MFIFKDKIQTFVFSFKISIITNIYFTHILQISPCSRGDGNSFCSMVKSLTYTIGYQSIFRSVVPQNVQTTSTLGSNFDALDRLTACWWGSCHFPFDQQRPEAMPAAAGNLLGDARLEERYRCRYPPEWGNRPRQDKIAQKAVRL